MDEDAAFPGDPRRRPASSESGDAMPDPVDARSESPDDSPDGSRDASGAAWDDHLDDWAWADEALEPGSDEAAPTTEDVPDDVRTTEWFSLDDDDAEEEPVPALPRRDHHVTAVVVSHDGDVWLPAVLTTLAAQTRPPDSGVGVDTGSVDSSVALLTESFGADRTLVLDHRVGFGEAVRAGLDRLGPLVHEPFTPEVIGWIWLLHDDSAPDPACLDRLLNTADDNPSAAILGPKILGWHDRRLLLEAGVTVTGSGRRVTNLDKREHDQGQKDGVRDVLAVSTAGMLIRRDVWEKLDGFDPALPLFRDDMDFCWRAHRAGERVIIATDAVLHHREASAHGRRADDLAPRPHRADREAAVHVLLAQASPIAGPFVALRLLLGGLVRAGLYLLGKDVDAARDEVGAVLAVALHPSKLRASRARIGRTATEPASSVRPLRAGLAQQAGQAFDAVTGVLTTSGAQGPSASVSALDSGPVGDDADYMEDGSSGLLRRLLVQPSVLLLLVLAAIAVVATRGLWLGDGVLQGGALLPAPPGATDLTDTYRAAWHDVGPGSTTPAPPYLMVIALIAFPLLGKAPLAVTVLLLLAIPVAGWSAYFCLRGLVASKWFRLWAGAAYALLPAMTGGVAAGRIGTTMVAIILPFAIRSLVRIWQTQGTVRRSAGTAILVAVVLSVAPILWIALVLAAVAALVYTWRTQGSVDRRVAARLAIGLLAPLLLLLPWTLYLVTHPVIWLLEPGINSSSITDPNLKPWDVLLLHPGGPGMTPVWVSLGIVVAGFVAFLRRDRLGIILPIGALGGLALLAGLVQSMLLVTPPGSTATVRPWPGQATLLLGLAMIAAAAVAVDGLRNRLTGSSFTLGQPLAAAVGVVALLAPVATAVLFGIGLDLDVVKAPPSTLPAFVAADAESAQAPRSLVLRDDAGGRVRYSLLTGPGLELGDAETGPPAEAWQQLDPYVAAMASGRGGDEIEALAGYGIRYVVLAHASSRALIPTLDGEPGLRRLSSSGGEVLWRVAGTTSRARMVEGDKQTPVGLAPDGTLTTNPYIDQPLPDGKAGRTLMTGAALDAGWHAVAVDGQGNQTDLAPVAGPGVQSWGQGFTAPAGTPQVTVRFNGTARSLWMWFQLLALLVLVVLALPERRRLDPDPDIDDPDPESDASDLSGAIDEEVAKAQDEMVLLSGATPAPQDGSADPDAQRAPDPRAAPGGGE